MEKFIKIVLSLLLFSCLLDMPYGYFQLVRFISMMGFIYLALIVKEQKNKNYFFVYIALALLFQPFIKIALGRIIWNIVDLIVGACLIISLFNKKAIK